MSTVGILQGLLGGLGVMLRGRDVGWSHRQSEQSATARSQHLGTQAAATWIHRLLEQLFYAVSPAC